MRDRSINGRNPARASSRKQATRFAVLAFVAADCAGIYYVQDRLDRQADAAGALAYQTPGAPGPGAAGSLTFTPAAPSLAVYSPGTTTAGTPAARQAGMASADAPASAPAISGVVATAAAQRPVLLGHEAPAARPAVAAARFATSLTAQRVTPAAGLGAPHLAVRPAAEDEPPLAPRKSAANARAARAWPQRVSQDAPLPAVARSSVFDNAFSLADEAPNNEHRFGQSRDGADGGSVSGSVSDTGLAGLLIPREDPAPMFDNAGIAPVTGHSATADMPAAADVPAAGEAAELPPSQG